MNVPRFSAHPRLHQATSSMATLVQPLACHDWPSATAASSINLSLVHRTSSFQAGHFPNSFSSRMRHLYAIVLPASIPDGQQTRHRQLPRELTCRLSSMPTTTLVPAAPALLISYSWLSLHAQYKLRRITSSSQHACVFTTNMSYTLLPTRLPSSRKSRFCTSMLPGYPPAASSPSTI